MAESDPRPRRWPYLLATGLAVLSWRLLMLLAGQFDRSDLVAFPGLGALLLPAALLVIALLLGRRRGRDYAGVFGMIAVVVAIITVGDVLEGGNPLDYLVWGPLALLLFLVPILIGLFIGANLAPARSPDQQVEIGEFRRYAAVATAGIAAPRERAESADELYQHALSRYEEAVAEGADHDAAVAATVAALGDAAQVAGELGQAHRQPLTASAIVLLVAAVIAFLVVLAGLIMLLFAAETNVATITISVAALLAAALAAIAVLGRRRA